MQDTTNHIQAIRDLWQSEGKLQLLVNQIPGVIYRSSADGCIDFFDRQIETLTGYPKEEFELRRLKWGDLILPEDLSLVNQIVMQALKSDGAFVREYRIRKKLGEIAWIREVGQIFFAPQGKIDYVSGLFIDITHQKKLEESLTQAFQELRLTQEIVMRQEKLRILGQMVSGIGHDISNSLMPILSNLNLLLNGEDLSPGLKDRYEAMHIAANDIANTINQLRGFYRLQEQEKPVLIDLNKIIEQAVNLTRFRWKDNSQQYGRTIEIKLDLHPNLPQVTAIESEIRGVLVNLLLNAIDAIPDNGCIILRSRLQRLHGVVEVEDTGRGMDKETLRRCTEHFFTTKGLEGSGLGLAMVKGTMQRCHGKMEIKSTVGKGTTVRLFLLYQKVLKQTCPESRKLPATPPPLHILHVEDDPTAQTAIRLMLEQDGHKVIVAENGQMALGTLYSCQHNDNPFDLLIADLEKPSMTGYELSAQIKRKFPDIPVFLLNKSITLENLRDLLRKVVS